MEQAGVWGWQCTHETFSFTVRYKGRIKFVQGTFSNSTNRSGCGGQHQFRLLLGRSNKLTTFCCKLADKKLRMLAFPEMKAKHGKSGLAPSH